MPVHVMSGVHIDHLVESGVTAMTVTFEVDAPSIDAALAQCGETMGVLGLQGKSFNVEQIGTVSAGPQS
jgi:cytosine/adenosine deaminase-related metal-dependent hydrolase